MLRRDRESDKSNIITLSRHICPVVLRRKVLQTCQAQRDQRDQSASQSSKSARERLLKNPAYQRLKQSSWKDSYKPAGRVIVLLHGILNYCRCSLQLILAQMWKYFRDYCVVYEMRLHLLSCYMHLKDLCQLACFLSVDIWLASLKTIIPSICGCILRIWCSWTHELLATDQLLVLSWNFTCGKSDLTVDWCSRACFVHMPGGRLILSSPETLHLGWNSLDIWQIYSCKSVYGLLIASRSCLHAVELLHAMVHLDKVHKKVIFSKGVTIWLIFCLDQEPC